MLFSYHRLEAGWQGARARREFLACVHIATPWGPSRSPAFTTTYTYHQNVHRLQACGVDILLTLSLPHAYEGLLAHSAVTKTPSASPRRKETNLNLQHHCELDWE